MNKCFKITAFFLLLTVLLIQVSLPVSANHSDTISLNANTLTYSISGGNITEVTPIPMRGGESFELSGTVREGETITLTVNGISSASSDSDYVRAEVSARIGQYQPGDSTNSDSDKSEYPVYGGSKQLSVSIPVIGNENVGFSAGNTLRFYRSGMYHNRTIYISGTLEVISDPQPGLELKPPPDPEPQQDPEPQPEPEPDVEPSLQITNCRERLKIDEKFTLALYMEGFPRNTMPIFQITSGEEYAFVSDSGVVTGVSPGRAVITVSASTGLPENQLISTTCSVEIYENIIEIINAPQILKVDEFVTLDVLVNDKSPDRWVDWEIDASSYNYVTFSGSKGNILTALQPGIATVHAHYVTDENDTISDSATIEIVFDEIEITPSELSLEVGQSYELTVNWAAQAQGVIWESSSPDIIEVSQAGVVTAIQAGDPVTITATLKGDELTKGQAIVITTPDVGQVILDIGGNRRASVGPEASTIIVRATVLPFTALNKDLMWYSTNPDFAFISNTGSQTAQIYKQPNKAGYTYVYARSVQNPEVTSNFVEIRWRPGWLDYINPWLDYEEVLHPALSEDDQKAFEEWLDSPEWQQRMANIEEWNAQVALVGIYQEVLKYPMAIYDLAKWWVEVPFHLLRGAWQSALKSFIFGIKSGLGIIPTALDHTIWAITQNKNWFEDAIDSVVDPVIPPSYRDIDQRLQEEHQKEVDQHTHFGDEVPYIPEY